MKVRKTVTCLAASASLLAVAASPSGAAVPAADNANSISFRQQLQSIDGLGFAGAFQRSTLIRGDRGLSAQSTQSILDLLFNRQTGAGASIVRIGIGSSVDNVYDHMRTIEPTSPGSPDATPTYVWDGDDGAQVWLTQQAQKYGVRRILADAWSAPGFMKTNGTDIQGGALCGVVDTSCASGDWRQAYANYLVQYLNYYRQEGVKITDLDFTNEPDFTASYASMRFTPAQAVDFVKVLGPTLQREGQGTKLVCCDSFGWHQAAAYSSAIEADPVADRYVAIQSGHAYASPTDTPLPTDDPTWMTEWGPGGNTWDAGWDSGLPSAGILVAQQIHQAFASANASAYVYWVAASLGATRAFIQIPNSGDGYQVSKRLWAFAAYSRFIRPDAVRVPAQAADPNVDITAFRNADGSMVVELLNTGTADVSTTFTTDSPVHSVSTYLTNEAHSVDLMSEVRTSDVHALTTQLPARSLTTLVLD